MAIDSDIRVAADTLRGLDNTPKSGFLLGIRREVHFHELDHLEEST